MFNINRGLEIVKREGRLHLIVDGRKEFFLGLRERLQFTGNEESSFYYSSLMVYWKEGFLVVDHEEPFGCRGRFFYVRRYTCVPSNIKERECVNYTSLPFEEVYET